MAPHERATILSSYLLNVITFIAVTIIILLCSTSLSEAESIGVCYGRVADNLPAPAVVVNMYKTHNIGKMRLYDADVTVLQAFQNSGVEVTAGVPNEVLQTIATDQNAANGWINDNIRPFVPATNIKYILVGNEIMPDTPLVPFLFPAMQNIHNALQTLNLQDQIKVSTAHKLSVLATSYPPSSGSFNASIAAPMQSILDFLAQTGAPFMANVYPYFSYIDNPNDIPLEYALFEPTNAVHDGNLSYYNLLDAILDALISAMESLGHSDLPIVITETGWPSAGNSAATILNAETYNNNVIRHVLSNVGTPKRPGAYMETFVFALFNEDLKPGDETEKNFGLFNPSMAPVYPVNFTI